VELHQDDQLLHDLGAGVALHLDMSSLLC
jgi:hypothetical protein